MTGRQVLMDSSMGAAGTGVRPVLTLQKTRECMEVLQGKIMRGKLMAREAVKNNLIPSVRGVAGRFMMTFPAWRDGGMERRRER